MPYLVVLIAVILAAPMSAAGDAAVSSPSRLPAIDRCVGAWNTSRLGNGRKFAAATSGGGAKALLFKLSDGSCGLVFPSLATRSAGTGLFVSAFNGDYLEGGPLETWDSKRPPSLKRLEKRADRRINIRVNHRTGEVVPDPGAKLPAVPFTGVSANPRCARFGVTLAGDNYRLVESDVQCLMVRIIVWAWFEGEGSTISGGMGRKK